jgi:hypothetical protein
MPVGPSPSDQDMQHELIPTCSVAVTLGADFDLTSQFSCGFAKELYVGTGGNVAAVLRDDAGTVQTYMNVPGGTFLHGAFVTVKSTGNGTTASNIIARR